MEILKDLGIILVCIVAIARMRTWLVDSAAKIAKRLGISELVIGLTICGLWHLGSWIWRDDSGCAPGHGRHFRGEYCRFKHLQFGIYSRWYGHNSQPENEQDGYSE